MSVPDQLWPENLPLQAGRALEATAGHWLPAESLALYARWWQLETWLRQLAYVELRARDGRQWDQAVLAASGRQSQDAQFRHMASTDTENPLAYLDYSQLIDLIGRNWEQFERTLIRRSSWDSRQEELARIRHRIGHVRRPHEDDLNRVEQTLRDLEHGAFIACASYNQQAVPSAGEHDDAVTAGWIAQRHKVARLIDHADNQYDTSVVLKLSRRPWATTADNLAGAPGMLWHASFFMRNRHVDVSDFWHAASFAVARPLVLHLVADDPSNISLTFAAADDDQAVADAIGDAVETFLSESRYGRLEEDEERRWRRRARSTDYRVIHATGWNIVDETTIPVSMFGAGGGMTAAIRWLPRQVTRGASAVTRPGLPQAVQPPQPLPRLFAGTRHGNAQSACPNAGETARCGVSAISRQ